MAGSLMKTALTGALLLTGADALGFMGQRGKTITEIAQDRFDKGLDGGVNLLGNQRLGMILAAANSPNSTLTKETVELPLDHFADCSDTFNNRYWVQEKYYKSGGPVIIYDGGEANAAGSVSNLEGGFFARMLKDFNAMGIVWEHRGYGASKPDEDGKDRTYLTVEQALADIPAMAANFSRPHYPSVDLTPASTPWIFVGGSYPGIRAAMSRETYPEIFHAAWAASAPVEAKINMWSYFYPVLPGMKADGKEDCLTDLQAAVKQIDEYLDDPSDAAMIKRKFFPLQNNTASISNGDFAYDLTTIWYGWQSSGASSMTGLCNIIEKDPETNSTAPPGGWAPVKGADYVINRLIDSGYVSSSSSSSAKGAGFVYDNLSWTWQYCTQFGFLQDYGPELDHILSKYNNVAYQETICHDAFPDIGMPAAKALNSKFGGWDMRPSNVFWSGDEFDPWRTKSPLSDTSDAPTGVTVSEEIPECGVATGPDTIFGTIMKGTEHCFEFFDSKQAKDVQDLWAQTLRKWLPCYQPKSKSAITLPTPKKCDASKVAMTIREPVDHSIAARVPIFHSTPYGWSA